MESSKIKVYFAIGLSITGLITLWLVNSTSSVIAPLSPAVVTTNDNGNILYQGKNMCTPDSYNEGKWVQQTIGLESNSIEGIESYAGYHCDWDFPHRCFRREGEFERSKAM